MPCSAQPEQGTGDSRTAEEEAAIPASGVVHLRDQWLRGLSSSLRERRGAGQDFTYLNLGDSIATGRIGITAKDQHYAAVAARITARHLGVPFRSALHAADDLATDGRTRISGHGWRIEAGGLYGGGCYAVEAGQDGVLDHLGEPGARGVRVGHRGGFDYSVDRGASWSRSRPGAADRVGRTELALAGGSVLIRARPDSGCRVYWLQPTRPEQPGIAWYTSGIGATRTRDLHRLLSEDGEAGYRAYGEAAPDLLTLEIGVNDTIHADVERIGDSRAALAAVIARLGDHGVDNIALVGAVPVRADFQPGPWRVADAYREIYRPLALENGIPLLDLSSRWGDHARAFAAGHLADQVHPTVAGHADIGAMVASLLWAATSRDAD